MLRRSRFRLPLPGSLLAELLFGVLIGACGDASGPAAPPEPPPPPQTTCIPSGDQSAINQVLTRVGARAVLCQGAVFQLKGPIVFTADSQQVYTEGLPTDDRRAILRIAEGSVWNAVDMVARSTTHLEYVVVDGNRRTFGPWPPPLPGTAGTHGLIMAGGGGTGQVIRGIRSYDARDWTALHVIRKADGICSGALVEDNQIGPTGSPTIDKSDGISFGCTDSTVRRNTIEDATDVGLVIFGAMGSVFEDNVIRASTQPLLIGISMADIIDYGGDFTGVQVRRNVIDARGDTIRVGMLMGRRVFLCIPDEEVAQEPRLYGAVVTDNRLEGDYMQYGFAVDGVRDWTLTGNIDNAKHSGTSGLACNGQMPSPPAGFQKYSPRADGQFQAEFKDAYLHGALHSVMAPPPPQVTCIPSGDQSAIKDVLIRVGAHAVLCQGAVFQLKAPVVFTADSQQVYTEGLPTDDKRAILRIAEDSVWKAVDMTAVSHTVLSNVIVDGNRPQLGRYSGPGDQFGDTHGMIVAGVGPATGQIIRQIKALESRDWTVLHVIGGCTNALVEENEIGPSGVAGPGGEWSDGISFGCNDSVVRKNTVTDATDVGIVIFGAQGSIIEDNVIRASTRTLLTGIGMADILGYGGNFTNVRVRRNVIDAQGDTIRVGTLMGRRVFVCIPEEMVAQEPRLYGAIITDNRLEGDYMQYGFAVDGVRDWTVTGNTDNAKHSGTPALACNGQMPSPPAGFQKYSPRADGQFQAEFKEAYLHGGLASVMPPRP